MVFQHDIYAGQQVLVTGGSSGIGAAIAMQFAELGAEVVALGLDADGVHAPRHPRIRREELDITDSQRLQRLFEALPRLDVLVNNAGMLEAQTRLENIDAARLHRVFATNVTGSFLCAREAVKRLSTRHGGRGGSIVNVSSMASRLGSPNEYIDYAAAKGAIDSMTIGLAREVAAEGIRVNAVRPGLIDTEIHASGGEPGRIERLKGGIPLGRGGTAEEVARAILWLASDEASYSTGTFIDVSGGR
ncbi:SDR family oxidoreductase [Pseudomonas aeruginosa]|nr:SDR family oxidoreductase [Pseudomonas aeruginosa]